MCPYKKYSGNGFTLVELIVVVTILAILGTIAFISFTEYSRDARNGQKSREISSIIGKISIERVKGVTLLGFVSGSGATLTGTSIKISGYNDYSSFSNDYIAGDLNPNALDANPDLVQDAVYSEGYKYGATILGGGSYEIAATIELGNGLDTYVVGDWSPRNSTDTRGARDFIEDNIFIMTGATYHEVGFKLGDQVGISSGTYTIEDMRADYRIYLDRDITTPGANIFLRRDETRHLIKKWDSNFAIDVGRGELFVPYK